MNICLFSLAIILYGTGDPAANTSAPATTNGWDCVGLWGGFTGTAISSNTFVAAAHVGGVIGQAFVYRGKSYPTVQAIQLPDGGDINLWKVQGSFPAWASLFQRSALGRTVTLIGRGTARGAPMFVYSNDPLSPRQKFKTVRQLAGWEWGAMDGRMRWGTNVISSGDNSRYCVSFSSAGRDTCTASLGDSSGACFVLDDDQTWKFAGVISFVWVTGPYACNPNGVARNGAFMDTKWLYTGHDQETSSYSSQTFITSIYPELWWITAAAGVR